MRALSLRICIMYWRKSNITYNELVCNLFWLSSGFPPLCFLMSQIMEIARNSTLHIFLHLSKYFPCQVDLDEEPGDEGAW